VQDSAKLIVAIRCLLVHSGQKEMEKSDYVIRGGIEGRERLRILSRVMRPTTLDLLRRVGIRPGMACLEIGCGGGDLAFDMARMVGPTGKVIGTDIDEKKLELAGQEAEEQQLSNVEFRLADITESEPGTAFDLVHTRFVLTHLANPAQALARMRGALRPGGVIVVEDIDFRGYFCHPDSPALWRYVELYTETVRRKGADANIGPRLPALLIETGFENVRLNVVQPAGTDGEVKLITPLTMQNIAGAVLAEGLASPAEVDQLVAELYEFAHMPGSVGCMPRVVEAWGNQSKALN
jgi:2-polyprenyl-3-methyl-5-hydroxy-6-metoxy-1,4-benzoquinol methylase